MPLGILRCRQAVAVAAVMRILFEFILYFHAIAPRQGAFSLDVINHALAGDAFLTQHIVCEFSRFGDLQYLQNETGRFAPRDIQLLTIKKTLLLCVHEWVCCCSRLLCGSPNKQRCLPVHGLHHLQLSLRSRSQIGQSIRASILRMLLGDRVEA